MAREIVVSLGGNESRFGMKKVERSKLYGSRKRIPLDPEGEACTKARLTEDGSMLIVSGMTAQGWFLEDGHWVPNKELVGLDEEGNELPKIDSTLGVAQALEGPIDPSIALDLRLKSVYALEPSEVDDALLEKLREGELYRFAFNYRADYQADVAVLIANQEGEVFALIGGLTEPAWLDAAEVIVADPADDEDDVDDLDFEMF